MMHENVPSVAQRRVLFVIAAPAEGRAVMRGLHAPETLPALWTPCHPAPGVDLVMSGVGKANAAAATARALDPSRHGAVVNLGIAGSLHGGPPILSLVLGASSIFADEGLRTAAAFTDIAALGFPPGESGIAIPGDPGLLSTLRPLAHAEGPIACVSTCSGADALAADIAGRTHAIAEAMEGAATALVAQRLGVPFVEFRIISNRTGDRERQAWDIHGALAALSGVIGPLAGAVLEATRSKQ